MTKERWQQVKSILQAALERAPEQRVGYLVEVCAGDKTLYEKVESLLFRHAQDSGFIEIPALGPLIVSLETETTSLLVGQTVGSYHLLASLGAGGMGEVYLAQDLRHPRKVALKVLPASLLRQEDRLRRFRQEAFAASALNHPNIVTIHDSGQVDELQFIVMEYVEGQTLRQLLATGALELTRALEIGQQVASALEAAHRIGIVHRDIKPENVMVRPDGYVKVLDFGLAKLTEDAATAPAANSNKLSHLAPADGKVKTDSGMVVGTTRYLSPEQARAQEVDARSDVFSLGVVLYEMLTGQPPFRGESVADLLAAILLTPPAPLAAHLKQAPADLLADLEAVVLKALAKEKEARQQTAQELLEELRRLKQEAEFAQRPPAPLASNRTNVPAHLAIQRHVVGREKEKAALRQGLETVRKGRGLILCASGESGIGKTVLVDEFLREVVEGAPACYLARGRCSERLAGAEAYLPFLEALESLLRDSEEQRLTQLLKQLAPTWYLQLFSQADEAGEAAQLRAASPERLKREVSNFLQALSQERPIILFLDDVHWADISTVELLAYLAGRFADLRLLVFVAYRPAELLMAKHPFVPIKLDLQARGLCRDVELEFLTPAEVARYIELEFSPHRLPADFPDLIHDKTEGNPLFMSDLLAYLRDRGVIAQTAGQWELTQPLPEWERELPQSLRALIQRKIEQLSADDVRLLMAASVQGSEFDSTIVAEAIGLEPVEVEERLGELAQIYGFVRQEAEQELPDRTLTVKCRFVHVLYQNALYAALPPSRRVALSRRLAETLLAHAGEQPAGNAAKVAFLFEEGREYARAAEQYLLASQSQAQVFANWEACELARRGLKLVALLPVGEVRDKLELGLNLALGIPLMMLKGYTVSEVTQLFQRSHELCRKYSEDASVFAVMLGLWLIDLTAGNIYEVRQIAGGLLKLAQKTQNEDQLILAHTAAGQSLIRTGDLLPALESFEQAVALYQPGKYQSHTLLFGFDTGVFSLASQTWVLWLAGYPERALQMSHQAVALAEQVKHPQSLAYALHFECVLHQFRREPLLTQQRAETIIVLTNEHQILTWQLWALVMLGHALALQGEHERGLRHLREMLQQLKAMGSKLALPHSLALYAEALAHAGMIEEALSAINEAGALAESTGDRYYEAEIYRLKGELTLRGDTGSAAQVEAEAYYQHALEICQRQQGRMFELRTTVSLCRLYQGQGKLAEAGQRLAAIYGWFSEGLATPDLLEAKTLLDEMSLLLPAAAE